MTDVRSETAVPTRHQPTAVNSVAGGVEVEPVAEVQVEGYVPDVLVDVQVDAVDNGDYVVDCTGNAEHTFGFFFSDRSVSRQSPTDVVPVEFDWDGGFRQAFIERSGDFHQIVRSFFGPGWVAAAQLLRRHVRRLLVAGVATVALLGALVLAPGTAAADNYRVAAGDSLWSIAVANGVTVQDLMSVNGLTSTVVRPGDVLQIPGAPWTGSVLVHEVRRGEVLSRIAETYDVAVSDILALNDLSNANLIRVGDTLEIPTLERPSGEGASGENASGEEWAITVNHRVQAGQSLGMIAAFYDVTIATVMIANDMTNPDLIRAGEVLQIPNVVPRTEQERLSAQFEHFAKVNDLPVDLVKAVAWQESRWQDDAVSSVGAMGIGQIMPGTAQFIQDRLLEVEGLDPWDAADNIEMMTSYLRYLMDEFDGETDTALGAYYQGPGAMQSHGFYGETDVYVASVLAFHQRFVDGELPG